MALNKTRPRNLMALLADIPAPRAGLAGHVSARAQALYSAAGEPSQSDSPANIGLYGVIGEDWTAARMSAVLRAAGGRDVTVSINSPGGDVIEGLAIYNQLRAYEGKVSVRIIGIAASAASFIAMAADDVKIGKAAYMMIHNAWTIAAGNKNDLRAVADWLDKADGILTGIYQDRTGADVSDISAAMDAETYMTGEEAVAAKYADSLLDSAESVTQNAVSASATALPKLQATASDSEMARMFVNLISSI